jgi:hypothetical protein
MNNYKTSKDYSHLKALLDAGQEIVCFTTFALGNKRKDDPNHFPFMVCDVCRAHKVEASGRYVISSRDFEYAVYHPSMYCYSSFEHMCQEHNIEFLDPDKPIHPNLVTELKQYLATTPPEQQQRDWEQIKAEIPDAGQVPVIFYGLSASISPATSTDNEPQSNQSDLDYLKSEIEKMHSFFLSESAEFPQCGAYQKAEAIADVLALFYSLPQKQLTHSVTKKSDQVPKFKIGDRIRLKQSKDTDTGVLITDISGRGRYLSEKGIICDIKEQDMWQLVPNYESGSLEQEYLRWFTNHFNGKRDISMSGEYLERGTQLELARYFAEYGKKEFIKAMKENHVDTI